MRNNITANNQQNQESTRDEVLKTTSLIYLKEALFAQKYEDCAELIQAASKFGALKSEIKEVIAGYLNGVDVIRQKKQSVTKTRAKGRRRF